MATDTKSQALTPEQMAKEREARKIVISNMYKTYLDEDINPSVLDAWSYRTVEEANKYIQGVVKLKNEEQIAADEKANIERVKKGSTLPVFMNTGCLIQFTDDPTTETETGTQTIWLYNKNPHTEIDSVTGETIYYEGTLIPVSSPEAFFNFTGGVATIDEVVAGGYVTQVPSSVLKNPDSELYNARVVPGVSGISGNGTMNIKESIRWRYGMPKNQEAEEAAGKVMRNIFDDLITKYDPKFTEDMFLNAFGNKENYATYATALAYGGYSIVDVYYDIMAHNKRVNGDPAYANYKGIKGQKNSTLWRQGDEYKKITTGEYAIPKSNIDIPGFRMGDWDLPIMQIAANHPEMFKKGLMAAKLNPEDPDVIAAIEAIETPMSDVINQMMESDNKEEMITAKENWKTVKAEAERVLGKQLSNNAIEAWNEVQSTKVSYSQRGIPNSGLFNEAMDMGLKAKRRTDEEARIQKLNDEEKQLREHLLNYGDANSIKNFVAKYGIEKAKQWGLVLDNEENSFWNMEEMKKRYPHSTEEDLLNMRNAFVIDVDGTSFKRGITPRNYLSKRITANDELYAKKAEMYTREVGEEQDIANREFTEPDESKGEGKYTYIGEQRDTAAGSGATSIPSGQRGTVRDVTDATIASASTANQTGGTTIDIKPRLMVAGESGEIKQFPELKRTRKF